MSQIELPQGLLPILDETHAGGMSTVEIIESFIDAEAYPFIVHHNGLNKIEYADYIQAISLLKEEMDFEYLLHHHVDRMPLSGALGIHLTPKSMSVPLTRETIGPGQFIGYSAYSLDEALKAEDAGADYILLGHIFAAPKEKPFQPVLGIEELTKTCTRLSIPVYAIGGINTENLIRVKDAGAAGFTALRAVYEDNEIDHNIAFLKVLWDELD